MISRLFDENVFERIVWDIPVSGNCLKTSSEGIIAVVAKGSVHVVVPRFLYAECYLTKWLYINAVSASSSSSDPKTEKSQYFTEDIFQNWLSAKHANAVDNKGTSDGLFVQLVEWGPSCFQHYQNSLLAVVLSSGNVLIFDVDVSTLSTIHLQNDKYHSLECNGLRLVLDLTEVINNRNFMKPNPNDDDEEEEEVEQEGYQTLSETRSVSWYPEVIELTDSRSHSISLFATGGIGHLSVWSLSKSRNTTKSIKALRQRSKQSKLKSKTRKSSVHDEEAEKEARRSPSSNSSQHDADRITSNLLYNNYLTFQESCQSVDGEWKGRKGVSSLIFLREKTITKESYTKDVIISSPSHSFSLELTLLVGMISGDLFQLQIKISIPLSDANQSSVPDVRMDMAQSDLIRCFRLYESTCHSPLRQPVDIICVKDSFIFLGYGAACVVLRSDVEELNDTANGKQMMAIDREPSQLDERSSLNPSTSIIRLLPVSDAETGDRVSFIGQMAVLTHPQNITAICIVSSNPSRTTVTTDPQSRRGEPHYVVCSSLDGSRYVWEVATTSHHSLQNIDSSPSCIQLCASSMNENNPQNSHINLLSKSVISGENHTLLGLAVDSLNLVVIDAVLVFGLHVDSRDTQANVLLTKNHMKISIATTPNLPVNWVLNISTLQGMLRRYCKDSRDLNPRGLSGWIFSLLFIIERNSIDQFEEYPSIQTQLQDNNLNKNLNSTSLDEMNDRLNQQIEVEEELQVNDLSANSISARKLMSIDLGSLLASGKQDFFKSRIHRTLNTILFVCIGLAYEISGTASFRTGQEKSIENISDKMMDLGESDYVILNSVPTSTEEISQMINLWCCLSVSIRALFSTLGQPVDSLWKNLINDIDRSISLGYILLTFHSLEKGKMNMKDFSNLEKISIRNMISFVSFEVIWFEDLMRNTSNGDELTSFLASRLNHTRNLLAHTQEIIESMTINTELSDRETCTICQSGLEIDFLKYGWKFGYCKYCNLRLERCSHTALIIDMEDTIRRCGLCGSTAISMNSPRFKAGRHDQFDWLSRSTHQQTGLCFYCQLTTSPI